MKRWLLVAGLLCAGASVVGCRRAADEVRVGSKAFTESVVLAEVAAQLARSVDVPIEHVRGLGGTRLLWEALRAGQLDLYPEYTGTITNEILAGEQLRTRAELRQRLAQLGLRMTAPLGFNNTYALGMKERRAAELGIRTISDLRDHPELVLRFSNEFMERGDGWPTLAAAYDLPQEDVRGVEHALAYEALDKGVIDVTDLYATDAKIRKLNLRVLVDDREHFPEYNAVFVYRADLADRAPDLVAAVERLEGELTQREMVALNARVELDDVSDSRAAAEFLREKFGIVAEVRRRSVAAAVGRYTLQHLNMTGVSLLAATLLAIPLGVLAARRERLAQPILGVVGIIQTIPSIALLVLLIKPIGALTDGLGYPQAVVALFLYSLLPIVRNTYTGLRGIDPGVHESAIALGLPAWYRLWKIELPLASRTILAGIKTAAVINVGFATLGGFIGAGGYGEPIFTGIRLNNYGVILQGAVPAALLAIAVQGLFELIERWLVPRGLRLKPLS